MNSCHNNSGIWCIWWPSNIVNMVARPKSLARALDILPSCSHHVMLLLFFGPNWWQPFLTTLSCTITKSSWKRMAVLWLNSYTWSAKMCKGIFMTSRHCVMELCDFDAWVSAHYNLLQFLEVFIVCVDSWFLQVNW